MIDGEASHNPSTATFSQRPRILMVAPQPFFRTTGTPINVALMCRALTEGGYEVHLATLPGGADVALDHLIVHRATRLPGVAPVPVGFSVGKLVYNLPLALVVARLLARRRFVAVHALEEAAFWAVPLARRCGVPGIVDLDSDLRGQLHDHGSPLARGLAAPAGWLRRQALRRAAGTLAVARHLRDMAQEENPEAPVFEIRDVPVEATLRAPDPTRQAALRRDLGLEGKRLLIYTGNYDRRQGLELLIRALPTVRRRHPDVVLLAIGGDPPRIRTLLALAEDLGQSGAIHLLEAQPAETMPEYMAMAEVLVSPRLEPHVTPLKVFSYMASGRPIVATDLPTHTEVLDADAAILAPPTAAGLAEAICRALDDPLAAARLGETARRRVRERHSYARFRQQMIDAYAAILGHAVAAAPPVGLTRAHG